MPCWLLTSTFYGQWLPGDPRGSVTRVRDRRAEDPATDARIEHNRPGADYEPAQPGLHHSARLLLKGPAIAIDATQAEEILAQFLETARHRGWDLHVASILFNHVHVVVEVPEEVGKAQLLRDFKSYASRRLSQKFGRPSAGTWWSECGSCRVVRHLAAAIFYTCHRQPRPLVVWSKARGRIPPEESDPANEFGDAGEEEV